MSEGDERITGSQETLERLEDKLRRDVRELVEVLRADVPAWVQRSIRQVFEDSPHADRLSDAQVAQLKAEAREASQRLGEEVGRELEPIEVWLWRDGDPPLPKAPEGLDPNPRVAAALARVGRAVGDLLERHGIPRAELGERATYRLPTYFVRGHFARSLVESYWRTLAHHDEVRRQLSELKREDRRAERRRRWDEA